MARAARARRGRAARLDHAPSVRGRGGAVRGPIGSGRHRVRARPAVPYPRVRAHEPRGCRRIRAAHRGGRGGARERAGRRGRVGCWPCAACPNQTGRGDSSQP
eukprot:3422047-Prymnesium_polylepis.1